jgi:hypothetical protein
MQKKAFQFDWLSQFARLHWYEATITFLFHFVAKTSELLLTAGIVVSTANFLTDGEILRNNRTLSLAWSWAQAIAIDSSLGVVCLNTIQAWRQRSYLKAIFFLLLTLLLASVAGLITHFDALAHAAGLPVTDRSVSGIIPLWVMTALRALAVIGFLVASRLQQMSSSAEVNQGQVIPTGSLHPTISLSRVDPQALAVALLAATQQAGLLAPVPHMEPSGSHVALPVPSSQPSVPPGTDALPRSPISAEPEQGEPSSLGTEAPSLSTSARNQPEPLGTVPAIGMSENRSGDEQWFPPVTAPQTDLRIGNRGEPVPPSTGEQSSSGHVAVESDKGNAPLKPPEPLVTAQEPATVPSAETTREARLEAAFLLLQAEGQRISGTALANRAGVRKQTALAWLQQQSMQPS